MIIPVILYAIPIHSNKIDGIQLPRHLYNSFYLNEKLSTRQFSLQTLSQLFKLLRVHRTNAQLILKLLAAQTFQESKLHHKLSFCMIGDLVTAKVIAHHHSREFVFNCNLVSAKYSEIGGTCSFACRDFCLLVMDIKISAV